MISLPDDVVLVLGPVVAVQQLGAAAELVAEWHIVGAQQRRVVGLAVEAYCNMPMSWDPCFTLKYPTTKRKLLHKCIWISVVQLVQIFLITALCSVDNNLHVSPQMEKMGWLAPKPRQYNHHTKILVPISYTVMNF